MAGASALGGGVHVTILGGLHEPRRGRDDGTAGVLFGHFRGYLRGKQCRAFVPGGEIQRGR